MEQENLNKLLLEERIKRMCHLSTFTKGFYLWFLALHLMAFNGYTTFTIATLGFWFVDAHYLALERFFIRGTKKPSFKTVAKTMVNSFSLLLYPLVALVYFLEMFEPIQTVISSILGVF